MHTAVYALHMPSTLQHCWFPDLPAAQEQLIKVLSAMCICGAADYYFLCS